MSESIPQPSDSEDVHRERTTFCRILQQADQPFSEFLSLLENQADRCHFGAEREDMLCDRIVDGIADDDVRTALVARTDLNYDLAKRMCLEAEWERSLKVEPSSPAEKSPPRDPPPAIIMDFWTTEDLTKVVGIVEFPQAERTDDRLAAKAPEETPLCDGNEVVQPSGDGSSATYKCGLCSYEAVKESSLLRHMRSHSYKRSCCICGLVMYSKADFELHLGTHTKEVPFVCQHCGHGFFRSTSYDNHDCRKRPKVCQLCGEVFRSKRKLIRHIQTNHPRRKAIPKKRYCHHCEFSCWSGDSLNTHLRTHAGNETLHCPHCTFEFTKLPALQRHMKIHKDEPSFSCPYCGAVFAKYGVVKIHMDVHKDGDLHHCSECSYKTPSKTNLKAHKCRVHNPKKHQCPHCNYKTAAKYRYQVHLLTHKRDSASHRCPSCDYTTKYKWDLKRHVQTHEKNPTYRCPHCAYTCSSLDNLKHHATKHSSKLPVPDFIGSL